jgi:hypothetical protein
MHSVLALKLGVTSGTRQHNSSQGFTITRIRCLVVTGPLQYKAPQRSSKLELEEAKFEITSVLASSSVAPDGAPSM